MTDSFRIPYNNYVSVWVGGIIPFSRKKMRKGVDKAMANGYACTAQLRLILPFSLVNTKSKKARRILPLFTGEVRLFALSESEVILCE